MGASAKDRSRIAICGIMKQEEPYILEWVAYHRLLGFDFIIADNGGTDGTTDLLKRLHAAGIIKRIDFTWCTKEPQLPAYRAMLRYARKLGYEFTGFLDTDEFFTRTFPVSDITPANGAEYLAGAFDKMHADQLSFHWLCYGSKDDVGDITVPVLQRFTHHAETDEFWNVNIKSFVRVAAMFDWLNLIYLGPPIFSAHYFASVNRRWFIDGERASAFSSPRTPKHAMGRVLHFQIKTWPEYQTKLLRGDVALAEPKDNRAFFERHNYVSKRTTVGHAIIERLRSEIVRLMSGKELARCRTLRLGPSPVPPHKNHS